MEKKCDNCESNATILVEGYIYARILCSHHAAMLLESIGGTPNEVEKMRVYA